MAPSPALILALFLGAGSAGAQGVMLERLADSSYSPPDVPGDQFYLEVTTPEICGEQVIFTGVTDLSVNGALYAASSSGIEVVANVGTPFPGAASTFQAALDPDCWAGRVFFTGGDDATPPIATGHGIFAWENGAIERLVAPGFFFGPIEVFGFNEVAGGAPGIVALAALRQVGVGGSDGVVAQLDGEPPRLIADGYSTLLPGRTTPPITLSDALFWRSAVVFKGTFGVSDSGIYRWTAAGGFELVADNETVYPEVGSSFAGFESLAETDAGLVFSSLYAGGLGIFLATADDRIVPLVVPGDVTVEGEQLISARIPRGSGSLLSFIGRTTDRPLFDAVFVRTASGDIRRIIGGGDVVEGATIGGVLADAGNGYVAINAELRSPPGARVIYRAEIEDGLVVDVPLLSPAAATLLFMILAGTGLFLLRRPPG